MNRILRFILAGVYVATLVVVPVAQEPPDGYVPPIPVIQGVGVDASGDVVIDLSQLMPYTIFTLDSPWRLVVEIPDVRYGAPFSRKAVDGTLVRRIRGYQYKEAPLISRVVLDLAHPVDYRATADGNRILVAMRRNEAVERAADKPPVTTPPAARKRDLLDALPREVITLDFEGADLRDVIRLMAETSNINMIYGPEVGGTISIHLRRVPFDEAFRTILNLRGLVATQLGANILRVTTPEILQRDQTKAINVTKSVPVNYLKAVDMQRHIQSVMTASGRRGQITVVQETNSLVITDSQEGIEQAERLIAQLDQRPHQVMIETRIVEVNLNDGFDIGVQWDYFRTETRGDRTYTYDGQSAFGAPGNFGIAFGMVGVQDTLNAALQALVTKSQARILSSPKIVTVNGQTASIEAVQAIPFRTSTVSGTGVVSNSFTTVNAGIKLQVTPTINAEDRITLEIRPESSFPTAESTEAGPIIRTRNASTTVIVRDGDTLVIGGLIDDSDSKGVEKVPLLGDIPIIGVFFRSTTNRKMRNELLVFVTPRIIRE